MFLINLNLQSRVPAQNWPHDNVNHPSANCIFFFLAKFRQIKLILELLFFLFFGSVDQTCSGVLPPSSREIPCDGLTSPQTHPAVT